MNTPTPTPTPTATPTLRLVIDAFVGLLAPLGNPPGWHLKEADEPHTPVAMVPLPFACTKPHHSGYKRQERNALLIVEAVNAHAGLVARVAELQESLKSLVEWADALDEMRGPTEPSEWPRVEAARKVLAKGHP